MAKTAYTHINCPHDSPTIYNKLMKKLTDIHNIDTRAAEKLNLAQPKFNNNYKKHSFHYCITTIWNSLPYPVKLKDTKATFVDALKRSMSGHSDPPLVCKAHL